MPIANHYTPQPVYKEIGEGFFDAVEPAQFPAHLVRYRNQRWADRLGLGLLSEAEWQSHFGVFEPLPGNLAHPLAMRYHGHQFRSYNPDIGDGRGFLFAQLRDPEDGRLLDLATKGSGQTPYSRTADGRLTLKGGVREVLVTELLEALGVYTSKSFSLLETGEELYRHDEPSPARSAVLVRLNHSHIRFGTFQRQAYEQSTERLWRLVNYSIEHYFPDLDGPDTDEKVGAFLSRICGRTAELVASWMTAGFVHGVLNTDNMTITGESFDYGPYRLLPIYDPVFVAAYFDQQGIYAFGRQPEAVFWNLKQLAGALSLICEKEVLVDALEAYPARYQGALIEKFLKRLGLKPRGEGDAELVNSSLHFMQRSQVGFERFFFDWYGGALRDANASPVASAYRHPLFADIRTRMERYEPCREEALSHAYFREGTPCTLLIDEIEAIWERIALEDDWTPFEAKLEEIATMREALEDTS